MACARGIWMSDLSIRRIGAADAEACAGIVMRWMAGLDWMPSRDGRDVVETSLREGLPLREAWGIGEPLAGYISIDAEAAHIGGFYVDRPGHGLGRLLMERAKTGRDFLKLFTHAANTRAHGFYRREGFVQIGAAWMGDDGLEQITMEWRR